VRLRKFGQELIKLVGGRKIHADFTVPGGVNKVLTTAQRDEILKGLPRRLPREVRARSAQGLPQGKPRGGRGLRQFRFQLHGSRPADGALELYDGNLRFCDATGKMFHDQIPPDKYLDYIGEAVEPWSYMKFPFISKLGYPNGMYRVGARAPERLQPHCHAAGRRRVEDLARQGPGPGQFVLLSLGTAD